MLLTKLSGRSQKKETLKGFKGIDRRPLCSLGSFYSMNGMVPYDRTSLRSGGGRWPLMEMTNPKGLKEDYMDYILFTDGYIFCGGSYSPGVITNSDSPTAVKFGKYVCVFPDKNWYDTETYEMGSLENSVTAAASVSLCDGNGTDFGDRVVGQNQPTGSNGDLWCDTSGETPVLKKYSGGGFFTVDCTYIKLAAEGIEKGFNVGDSVKIESSALSGSYIIRLIGEGYIAVGGIIPEDTVAAVTVSREVPDIIFAVEYGNRIWGLSADGSQIFASALGSKENFYTYEGTAADSYTVSLGEDSPFTGIAEYNDTLYFFKYDVIYALHGTKPQNFTVSRIKAPGIKNSTQNAAVKYGGYLYYYSPRGLMRFDGAQSEWVDMKLKKSFAKVSLAATSECLYLLGDGELYCMYGDTGEFYELEKSNAKEIAVVNGMLAYITDSELGCYIESKLPDSFLLEFSETGYDSADESFISKIEMSLFLAPTAELSCYIAYGSGDWELIKSVGGKAQEFTLPLMLRRHRTFKLKLVGSGEFKLFSLSVFKSEVR